MSDEIDLSGMIDFSQAERVANYMLRKTREDELYHSGAGVFASVLAEIYGDPPTEDTWPDVVLEDILDADVIDC